MEDGGGDSTHNFVNISLAASGSITGVFGLAPGAIAPSPIILNVLLIDHPSGISSSTATYLFLEVEQVCPTDRMIFWIVPSFTKSSSRKRYGF